VRSEPGMTRIFGRDIGAGSDVRNQMAENGGQMLEVGMPVV
jgi:hypothetical protein